MDYYITCIMKAAKVAAKEARLIETVMRNEFGTLDHLTAGRFDGAARRAKKYLDLDPELRKLIEEQTMPTGTKIHAVRKITR